jgi:hypothetical protein
MQHEHETGCGGMLHWNQLRFHAHLALDNSLERGGSNRRYNQRA